MRGRSTPGIGALAHGPSTGAWVRRPSAASSLKSQAQDLRHVMATFGLAATGAERSQQPQGYRQAISGRRCLEQAPGAVPAHGRRTMESGPGRVRCLALQQVAVTTGIGIGIGLGGALGSHLVAGVNATLPLDFDGLDNTFGEWNFSLALGPGVLDKGVRSALETIEWMAISKTLDKNLFGIANGLKRHEANACHIKDAADGVLKGGNVPFEALEERPASSPRRSPYSGECPGLPSRTDPAPPDPPWPRRAVCRPCGSRALSAVSNPSGCVTEGQPDALSGN